MRSLLTLVLIFAVQVSCFAELIPDSRVIACSGVEASISDGRVEVKATSDSRYASCSISRESWGVDRTAKISASVKNVGRQRVNIILFVVGSHGWNSVAKAVTLEVGESERVECNLRDTFKDGTPRLNPSRISHLEVMMVGAQEGCAIELSELNRVGVAPKMAINNSRLETPDMVLGLAEPAKRVKYKLSEDSALYGALYLPRDWRKGESYPLIVEFPGNIFYTQNCYSTGRPEQCAIGYGVTKGEGAIWLSLPFVNYSKDEIALSGWGNASDCVDFTIKMVERICLEFGADPSRVVLSGFSRGAIACGFIGLRSPEIASLWCGIIPCQHYDGDGWGGSKYDDARVRLENGADIPQFHIDNDAPQLLTMLEAANVPTTYSTSGIGGHTTDMCLDDRTSTLQLREWFWNTIK